MQPHIWRRMVALASVAVGGLLAAAAVAHMVAVTHTALTRRGGLDARWSVLIVVGLSTLAAGLVVAACCRPAWRASAVWRAWMAASGAAALYLFAVLLLLVRALGPVGPILLGAYLVLWAISWQAARPGRRQHPPAETAD